MNPTGSPTVVIVPGLRDHVPDHWQTVLADRLGDDARTVPPLETGRLSRDAQVAALEGVLSDIGGPVVLIAHSAGVLTTVHWARRHHRPVRGALLAAPPDFETPLPEGYPTPEALRANGWTPTPRTPLPFPSIVAASTNDPPGRFRERRRPRTSVGRPLGGPRPRGTPQPGRGLRRVAAGRGVHPRAQPSPAR